jgi:glycosyltransferase involved in cell wall biosynthesis
VTSRPSLTIGLPVYNAAPWLEDTLRSVFAQTFGDWELLVVDDGSTDASVAIAESVRDPRLRVLADGRHRGLAARLNQVAARARADCVARMDADDLMHPRRLELQMEFLRTHPEVDGVGCGLVILDRQDRPCGVRILPADHPGICRHPLKGIGIGHATFLARTEWLRRYPYDERNLHCEDWGLWFSSYVESRFANLDQPLYFYRDVTSFRLGKYVRDKRSLARFLWREGRPRFGAWPTALEVLGQYLRLLAYLFSIVPGVKGLLLRRRNQPLDEAQRRALELALRQVRSLGLPL